MPQHPEPPPRDRAALPPALADVQVVVFDVFGTVVDWHGSIVREMAVRWPQVDGHAFALAWRAGYQPAMERVRNGSRPWTVLDTLHREVLDEILPCFGLGHLDEAERIHLNRVWHRLDAWPDSAAGLQRLRQRLVVGALSNGNIGLLTRMAKHAGLPWDCVLSAEVFHAYKPLPAAYLGVARVLDVPPAAVLLAAAHHDDLAAARACGLRTAYIERPFEYGVAQPKDVSPQPGNDLHCHDIAALAAALGC